MNRRASRTIFRGRSVSALSPSRRRNTMPRLESLENRQLLSTVDWISPTSGSWDVGSNWKGGNVPGPRDDAVVDVPGVTVTISTTVESVDSITAADPLDISGGGLTVVANSTISGGLTMTAGSLTASGSGVSLIVSGTTTASGANLYAQDGATLDLSQLTSYTGGVGDATTLEATGTGSELSLSKLATITADATQSGSLTQVLAGSGGDVELPVLSQVNGGGGLVQKHRHRREARHRDPDHRRGFPGRLRHHA